MRRALLTAVLLALTVLVGPVPRAAACSCVPPSPSMIGQADAAFVGTAADRTESGQDATYRFDVERVLKGRLPASLDVATSASGASCGLEMRVGARAAVVLTRRGSEWSGNLCQTLTPDSVSHLVGYPPEDEGGGTGIAWLPMALLAAGAVAIAVIGERRGRNV